MDQVLGAINEVATEYPEVRGITVTTETEPVGVYAYASSEGKIAVNDLYTSDPDVIPKMMANDVAKGFHPVLGHCTAAEFLAYHESTHIIDFARGRVADDVLTYRFGDGVQLHGVLSGYSFNRKTGTINPPEALAEAFASVKCNDGNWAEQELYHLIAG